MADLMLLERQIASSQTLAAMASYFSSPEAKADRTLYFAPAPAPPEGEEKEKVA